MNMFITYKVEVENQLNKNIKILKSDRGGEYESNSELCAKFDKLQHHILLSKMGLLNGRTDFEGDGQFHLVSSGAPQNLWGKLC